MLNTRLRLTVCAHLYYIVYVHILCACGVYINFVINSIEELCNDKNAFLLLYIRYIIHINVFLADPRVIVTRASCVLRIIYSNFVTQYNTVCLDTVFRKVIFVLEHPA